ncbi:MAG TPA: carboxypeptidase-like regulatory domain-containing protein [Kofleriaceae bacterium]|jgi:hypothetical protein
MRPPRGPRGLRHPSRWGAARNRTSLKIWGLTGQVLAANGTAIAGVVVDLFEASTRRWLGMTTTDSDGIFTFNPPTNTTYFAVADYDGATEQAGSSVRNLVPS